MGEPLIFALMKDCHLYNKSRAKDGYGGTKTVYTKGVPFKAEIIKNSTTEAIVAEKQIGTGFYTVVVEKGFVLDYKDVFVRDSDGMRFVVTAGTNDSEAPEKSTIPIAKATAEPWLVPDGVIVEDATDSTDT